MAVTLVLNAPFASAECTVPDNGTGTVTLPPEGCPYLSPDEVHMIIDGLPPGTEIILEPIHQNFICKQKGVPQENCNFPGGNLGGEVETFQSSIQLQMTGTGDLSTFSRLLSVPLFCEVHTGPRNPGDPVQNFPNEMVQLQGSIFGDPDFDQLTISAGSIFGLPSPGQTTLTDLGGGSFQVDSFFDIEYRIDFQGAPGSVLEGMSGSTQGSVRMEAGGQPQDWLTTWIPNDLSEDLTSATFGSPDVQPIPNGFFDPGSDPFFGTVFFRGQPLNPAAMGDTSVVMERDNDPFLPPDPPGPTNVTVPIEIIELSLVSAEPITVTYNGGLNPEAWMVALDLSPVITPPPGQLTATKDHQNGGTFDADFFVQPRFIFTRVSDSAVQILDTGASGDPPVHMNVFGVPWVHNVNPGLGVLTAPGSLWVPGIVQPDPLDINTQQEVPFTPDSDGGGVSHTVCEPVPGDRVCIYDVVCVEGDCSQCPAAIAGACIGAACPNNTCGVLNGLTSNCGNDNCCIEFGQFTCDVPPNLPPCPPLDDCVCEPQPGACCLSDGTCIMVPSAADCPGVFHPGASCTGLVGCCFQDGSCTDLDPLCCADLGGTPNANGSLCDPPEACCYTGPLGNTLCADLEPDCCADIFGGMSQGAGSFCQGDNDGTGVDDACEGGPLFCPEPAGSSICANLQQSDCDTPLPNTQCLPTQVTVDLASFQVVATTCDCLTPGPDCGSIDVQGTTISCPGTCPVPPFPPGFVCQIHINGAPTGQTSIDATDPNIPPNAMIECDCAPPADEACCFPTGACANMPPADCTANGGVPQGAGTVCLGIEACCINQPGAAPTCIEVDRICCDDLGGVPQGPNSSCQPEGACCTDDDGDGIPENCVVIAEVCCDDLGGTYQGDGTQCQGVGACCADIDGIPGIECYQVDGICCDDIGGMFQGAGTPCLGDADGDGNDDACVPPPNFCPLPADQFCAQLQQFDCDTPGGPNDLCLPLIVQVDPATGAFTPFLCDCLEPGGCGAVSVDVANQTVSCQGQCPPGEVCEVFVNGNSSGNSTLGLNQVVPGDLITCDCERVEACCDGMGGCVMATPANCIKNGGTPQGAGTTCLGIQACCIPNAVGGTNCVMVDAICCDDLGGVPQGPGSSCSVTGACCYDTTGDGLPDTCSVEAQVCCDDLGGIFQGPGTTCLGAGACCFDADGDGVDESCTVLDQQCCDDIGGTFQGVGTVCLGDGDGNGIDDACEPSCPLPDPTHPCAPLQIPDCLNGDASQTCEVSRLRVIQRKQIALTFEKLNPDVIAVPGVGQFVGNRVCIIGDDPQTDPTEQTAIDNRFADTGTIQMTYQIVEFGGTVQGNEGCAGGPSCGNPLMCLFDQLVNIAQGGAQLSISPQPDCNLVVSNIGSSGKDGVRQDPLPPGTTRMETGFATPNFSLSGPGSRAEIRMEGDPPGQLCSLMTIENLDGQTMRVAGDISPAGVTKYKIVIYNDDVVVADLQDVPDPSVSFARDDILLGDCEIKQVWDVVVEECDCFDDVCGPVRIIQQPGTKNKTLSCENACPPGQLGQCQVFIDGSPSGDVFLDVCDIPVGSIVTCDCACPQAEKPRPDNKLGLTCNVDADCPAASVCVDNECYIPKSKYISLRPGNAGQMVALRVTMIANNLFPALVGAQWWVTPATGNEPAKTFRLGCAKHYQDWSTAPAVIHVGDIHITTQAVYRVEAVHIDCDNSDPNSYSAPVDLPTVLSFGDAVGNAINVPNGVTNLEDVFAAIQTFQGNPNGPNREQVDVDGDIPNAVVNLADAFAIVQGFQTGGAYPPAYNGPKPCP